MKRLDALERSISFRRPRWINILVDANSEDQSAADAILQDLAPIGKDDFVILLKQYNDSGDGSALPRLLSVTPLC